MGSPSAITITIKSVESTTTVFLFSVISSPTSITRRACGPNKRTVFVGDDHLVSLWNGDLIDKELERFPSTRPAHNQLGGSVTRFTNVNVIRHGRDNKAENESTSKRGDDKNNEINHPWKFYSEFLKWWARTRKSECDLFSFHSIGCHSNLARPSIRNGFVVVLGSLGKNGKKLVQRVDGA